MVVHHGPWVETGDGFFIEGAWDGSFKEARFDRSCALMGSGARLTSEKVVFYGPSHTLERLHLFKDTNRVLISPSMAFLLSAARRRLDIRHIPYQVELLRMIKRTEFNVGHLPLEGGEQLQVIIFRNVEVDSRLNIKIGPKAEPPDFSNFGSYRAFLAERLQLISENCEDSGRRVKFRPISTLSTGYDSVACSALATEIGCSEAVTFRDCRPEGVPVGANHDSGEVVGEYLGFKVKAFNRTDYLGKAGFPEAEFVVCGDLGQDLPWAAFEDEFRGRMVLNGTHGDVIWNRHLKPHGRQIVRKEMSGCSLSEFKFRVGFVHVIPPFFGALSHPSIYAISNSREMASWRVGGRYDRPIPRRIAEEKGVPRDLFGSRKNAVAVLLNRDDRLREQLSRESYSDFEAFYQKNKHLRDPVVQKRYDSGFRRYCWWQQSIRRLRLSSIFSAPISDEYKEPPGRPSFLVHWAFPMIQKRYESALRGALERGT